jgi:hypothetical protein
MWATTSSSEVLRHSLQASPFLSTHLTLLLSLALYSSLVSRCFCSSHVSYPPIYPKQSHRTFHTSYYPCACFSELALRVVGFFRLLELFYLIGLGSYHILYFMVICCWRYSWLTLMLIIKIELSRGIGESFCQFYDGSLVSPRTPRSHELFW